MMVLLIEFQERATKAGETAASNRNKNGTEDRREKKNGCYLILLSKTAINPAPCLVMCRLVDFGRFW